MNTVKNTLQANYAQQSEVTKELIDNHMDVFTNSVVIDEYTMLISDKIGTSRETILALITDQDKKVFKPRFFKISSSHRCWQSYTEKDNL